ncbi:MAG: ABC transporter permease [Anaerolineae bacterium]
MYVSSVERSAVPGTLSLKPEAKLLSSPLPPYLAIREVWRNKGRFLLVSLVIALITTLVLFIAGLAEGLGAGNIEYIDKLNAELVLFQEGVDLSTSASQISRSRLNEIRRVEGVKDAGLIGFSSASIVFENNDEEPLDISLIGVEAGRPGEPPVLQGRGLKGKSANEVVIDRNVALRTGLEVGDQVTIKSIQGTDEEFYTLAVVGISDGRQYFIRPSLFVPYLTWDRIRPKGFVDGSDQSELIFNIAAVKLDNPDDLEAMAGRLESQVSKIEAVDRKTAYEATPGYSAQQSTLNTIRIFTLLIGVLVIGGFFQIQTLQKVAQIGMLKAIGASTSAIAAAFVVQIIYITLLGVALGSAGTLALSLSFPVTVPIVFTRESILLAVGSLVIIGPLGGLVSLVYLLRIEPLTALGLTS